MWIPVPAPFEEDTEGQEALYRALYSAVNKAVKSAHRLPPSSLEVTESSGTQLLLVCY